MVAITIGIICGVIVGIYFSDKIYSFGSRANKNILKVIRSVAKKNSKR